MSELCRLYQEQCVRHKVTSDPVIFSLLSKGASQITNVTLTGMPMGKGKKGERRAFLSALEVCSRTEVIDISQCDLQDKGLHEFCLAVGGLRNLRTLNISFNMISADGARGLFQFLGESGVTTLDASGNSMARGLSHSLPLCLSTPGCSITTLLIGNNDIDLKTATGILEAIAKSTTVTMLSLAESDLPPEAGARIGEMLTANKHLIGLDLRYNRLGDAGCAALAEGLKVNRTLLRLVVASNEVGDGGLCKGLKALAGALAVNRTLESIDIGGNTLDLEGLEVLCGILKSSNATLLTLRVTKSKIGDGGIQLLADMAAGSTLHFLDLRRNTIGRLGFETLIDAVSSTPTLGSVLVDPPEAGDEFAELKHALMEACAKNREANLLADQNIVAKATRRGTVASLAELGGSSIPGAQLPARAPAAQAQPATAATAAATATGAPAASSSDAFSSNKGSALSRVAAGERRRASVSFQERPQIKHLDKAAAPSESLYDPEPEQAPPQVLSSIQEMTDRKRRASLAPAPDFTAMRSAALSEPPRRELTPDQKIARRARAATFVDQQRAPIPGQAAAKLFGGAGASVQGPLAAPPAYSSGTVSGYLPPALSAESQRAKDIASGQAFAVVVFCHPGSPADNAGIRTDDLVCRIGNVDRDDKAEIVRVVQAHENMPLEFVVLRNGVKESLYVHPRAWAGAGLLGCGTAALEEGKKASASSTLPPPSPARAVAQPAAVAKPAAAAMVPPPSPGLQEKPIASRPPPLDHKSDAPASVGRDSVTLPAPARAAPAPPPPAAPAVPPPVPSQAPPPYDDDSSESYSEDYKAIKRAQVRKATVDHANAAAAANAAARVAALRQEAEAEERERQKRLEEEVKRMAAQALQAATPPPPTTAPPPVPPPPVPAAPAPAPSAPPVPAPPFPAPPTTTPAPAAAAAPGSEDNPPGWAPEMVDANLKKWNKLILQNINTEDSNGTFQIGRSLYKSVAKLKGLKKDLEAAEPDAKYAIKEEIVTLCTTVNQANP